MRIIDKNTDFYDYLQGVYRDDSVVFDRTDSFVLTKEIVCGYLYRAGDVRFRDERPYRFALLQIGHGFWLFLMEITKRNDDGRPEDYTVDLVAKWENFNKKCQVITLDIISFGWDIYWVIRDKHVKNKLDKSRIVEKQDVLMHAVDHNDYLIACRMDKHTVYHGDGKKVEKNIPLLKASGFAGCIDPLDVYLALEESFLSERSGAERTESVGLTNDEKIENHGFDLKTSFRGK